MISHPFIDTAQLRDLSLEELQTKISDLNKKMMYASRINHPGMRQQLAMMIESYNQVYQDKIQEQYKKMNLDGKINITK